MYTQQHSHEPFTHTQYQVHAEAVLPQPFTALALKCREFILAFLLEDHEGELTNSQSKCPAVPFLRKLLFPLS
jgi:hypothetical protein